MKTTEYTIDMILDWHVEDHYIDMYDIADYVETKRGCKLAIIDKDNYVIMQSSTFSMESDCNYYDLIKSNKILKKINGINVLDTLYNICLPSYEDRGDLFEFDVQTVESLWRLGMTKSQTSIFDNAGYVDNISGLIIETNYIKQDAINLISDEDTYSVILDSDDAVICTSYYTPQICQLQQ